MAHPVSLHIRKARMKWLIASLLLVPSMLDGQDTVVYKGQGPADLTHAGIVFSVPGAWGAWYALNYDGDTVFAY